MEELIMKKNYVTPEAEIVMFSDVIITSSEVIIPPNTPPSDN